MMAGAEAVAGIKARIAHRRAEFAATITKLLRDGPKTSPALRRAVGGEFTRKSALFYKRLREVSAPNFIVMDGHERSPDGALATRWRLVEEGDYCLQCGEGAYTPKPEGDCRCHMGAPPCRACTDARLTCAHCEHKVEFAGG